MIDEQLNVIFDRVRRWPRERQREVAEMLALIEEQDSSPFGLTDEQLAEVRRRRADTGAKLLTLEEFDARLSRFGL
jgi:hypothetical protein